MLTRLSMYLKWWHTWKTLPVLNWVKAASLYRKGEYNSAIKYYEQGINKHHQHPAYIYACIDLAHCYFKTGQLSQAEEQLKQVTGHSPQLKEGHLRLAHLQSWTGRPLEAAWTIRRALREISADAELIAIFMLAVIENEGPDYLLKEATEAASKLLPQHMDCHKLQVAKAKFAMLKGSYEEGRTALANLATASSTSLEAILLFSEVLLQEGKVSYARQQLRRAMTVAPDHPRLLSLFAQTYLKSGPFYNPDFARQLATQACQSASWQSAREMHILAETYYHVGDKAFALLVASKAKQAGNRLLGAYRDVKTLDKLIEDLSSGSQA